MQPRHFTRISDSLPLFFTLTKASVTTETRLYGIKKRELNGDAFILSEHNVADPLKKG